MNYESWISYRYLTARKDRFVSTISFISIAGVAIGVMALLVVIGVMTGFDHDLREKIVGTNAHIVIEKENGLKGFEVLQKIVNDIPGIKSSTDYIHGNVFLEDGKQAMGLNLRGVNPTTEATVTKVNEYLQSGKIENLTSEGIIIGSQLAFFYGYNVGDELTIIAPASGVAGEDWRYKFKVAGIFTSGMYDYDMNLVLVSSNKAKEIFHLSQDQVTGIAVKLDNVYAAPAIKEKIHDLIGFKYSVRTWIDQNRNFFAALRLEKFAMFIILTLIVLVASFNIVSTLIVTVTSKIKDIGILKSIGVPKQSIRNIFMMEGLAIGVVGTFWGLLGGMFLCWVLKTYQFIKLPQEIYYIDRLPVLLQLSDVLMIVSAAVIISYLATIYPSFKAANLEPVEALRYQ